MEDHFKVQQINSRKRVRDAADSDKLEVELPEVKRLRDDLLDLLDDSDTELVTQDLVSVMRSFQEELSGQPSPSPSPVTFVDLTLDSELGYLLEASDDDLGLPPSSTPTSTVDEGEVIITEPSSESSSMVGELWGIDFFSDQKIPSYDSLESETSEFGEFGGVLFEYCG